MHDLLMRLAINRIDSLKPYEKLQLEDIIDSESFFLALNPHLLTQIVGRTVSDMDRVPSELLSLAERDIRFFRERDVKALSYRDERYPAVLKEIFDPPYMIYVRGELPPSDRPAISIVGTREPTAEAVIAAMELGRELSGDGIWVISGLARGIDVAAHQGALGDGGRTGAILASGIDMVTPISNRGVAARILDAGGFLLSEYAPGSPALKYRFPARNRIISGLSRGVVVIQAPSRSGALITADYALDHGRDLFVHSAGMAPDVGAGSADLAADGALIISDARDIYTEWGIEAPPRESFRLETFMNQITSSAEAGHQLADSLRAVLLQGSGKE